jgi:hypothetical protein
MSKQTDVGGRLAQGLGDNIGSEDWELKNKKLRDAKDFSE